VFLLSIRKAVSAARTIPGKNDEILTISAMARGEQPGLPGGGSAVYAEGENVLRMGTAGAE
jgi:hypothetical protein